jgi:hypothetical protein
MNARASGAKVWAPRSEGEDIRSVVRWITSATDREAASV